MSKTNRIDANRDFYADPTPAGAVRLAKSDEEAMGYGTPEFFYQLNRAADACEREAELVAALRDALAFVELSTGRGVRKQPRAEVRLENGDFDAEAIAENARDALSKVPK